MTTAFRSNRKATDADLIRYNSVGISLAAIGKILGVHPTTVTLRLQALGVRPADTRRAFMEDVLQSVPATQAHWLMDQLGPNRTIKAFIRDLLVAEFVRQNQGPKP